MRATPIDVGSALIAKQDLTLSADDGSIHDIKAGTVTVVVALLSNGIKVKVVPGTLMLIILHPRDWLEAVGFDEDWEVQPMKMLRALDV
jgi:hypothetical protein